METVASREGHDRIAYLDGLRGIAISLVVLFHAYSGWPKLVPYGDRFASFPPFAYGKFGVQLFFLISGFVIFMTLERCASIKEFAWRRWIRLFPAMFVCSLLVWLTSNWFPERPAGPATASQLIPGLTFIDPVWFQSLGLRLPAIEGAYWTIFVEAQFYLVAGVTYFLLGRQRALAIVLGLFFLAAIVALGRMIGFPVPPLAAAVMKHLSAIYFGWFAAGALFYFYYAERSPRLLVAALTVALLAVCTTKSPVAIVIPALFMAPQAQP